MDYQLSVCRIDGRFTKVEWPYQHAPSKLVMPEEQKALIQGTCGNLLGHEALRAFSTNTLQ
jgi:hypothetical protein